MEKRYFEGYYNVRNFDTMKYDWLEYMGADFKKRYYDREILTNELLEFARKNDKVLSIAIYEYNEELKEMIEIRW